MSNKTIPSRMTMVRSGLASLLVNKIRGLRADRHSLIFEYDFLLEDRGLISFMIPGIRRVERVLLHGSTGAQTCRGDERMTGYRLPPMNAVAQLRMAFVFRLVLTE